MTLQLVMRSVMTMVMIALAGLILWRWQINGWGSIVWLASAIIMMLIRSPYAARNKENVITEQFAVSKERVLLFLVSVGGTLLPVLHLSTGLLLFTDYEAPNWLPVIGILFLVPGFWLFWRSHADLGQNWSVTTELREAHTLVSNGVYKHIRHPMYSAIWLIFLSYPFLIQNWIVGSTGLVSFAIMYAVRVPIEEAMMRQEFGIEYEDYSSRTGRLWPQRSK